MRLPLLVKLLRVPAQLINLSTHQLVKLDIPLNS
nr:MAG TPA: hypothetical protein [Caudoviricetes sp.]